jgi:non-heme chloroperoxidase
MPMVTLASGLALSYAGGGDERGPVVLLLPGPTDSWRSYQHLFDLLPPDIRVIAVSQRGHGRSHKPPTGYRVEDFASDVVPLLDALGVQRAVLAGHSGSCLVARRVALDSPDRVVGLVLEASPMTLRDDSRLLSFVRSDISQLDDPISADFARPFVVSTSSQCVPADMVDLLVEEALAVPARVWQQTFGGLLEYDDRIELPLIEAPTLLVWGDADPIISRRAQDALAGAIPDADLVVYAGVGHTPRWERPGRFSHDLGTFARAVWPAHS